MGDHSKTLTYILVSACLSLLLHGAFFSVAEHLQLQLFPPNTTAAPPRPARPMQIQTIDPRDRIFQRPDPQRTAAKTTTELADAVRSSEQVKKIFEQHELIAPPKPQLQLTGLGRNLLAPQLPAPEQPRQLDAPRPAIMQIDAQSLTMQQLASKPNLTPQLPRQNLALERVPSLVGGSDYQAAVGPSVALGMRLTMPSSRPPQIGALPVYDDGIAGDDAARLEGERSGFAPAGGAPPLLVPGAQQPGGGRNAGTSDAIGELDSLLNVQVYTYEAATGDGYFRMDISPNLRSDSLNSISKDMLFLIDCSSSISQATLGTFRDGVIAALDYLHPRDRFNIVSFRERPEPLFADFVPVQDSYITEARNYLRRLMRGGGTDVYAGLAPYVELDQQANPRPLNVFLLSDGQSTVENKLDNDTLIRRIASGNRNDVSIYAFSVGTNVNLFLMDFLAYSNRGQSLHEREMRNFQQQLVNFIASHSDLIVEDLHYRITDGMTETIFPRKLQHLYRGKTLSIYGRYGRGTRQMAVQIIGRDASGNLKELVFRTDLNNARQAGSGLARDWAAQKVFHLISEQTLQTGMDHSQEIRRLAQQFGFHIPYL